MSLITSSELGNFCFYSFDDGFLFAEKTFILLDKDLVEGKFDHGDPHVEGNIRLIFIL